MSPRPGGFGPCGFSKKRGAKSFRQRSRGFGKREELRPAAKKSHDLLSSLFAVSSSPPKTEELPGLTFPRHLLCRVSPQSRAGTKL